jgi:TolB-like protein
MSFYDFFKDLRNRKFFKEISIYAIAAWLIIQVTATTFPHIGVPGYWVTIVIILSLVGLPIFMLISWRYNMFDEEESPAEAEPGDIKSINIAKQFRNLTSFVGIAVIFISGLIIWNKFLKSNTKISKEDKVAVAIFDDMTGDPTLSMFGKLISNYLTQGLSQTNSLSVVSFNSINNQSQILIDNNIIANDEISKAGAILAEKNKANKLIKGNYFLEKDRLRVMAEISSSESNIIEIGFSDISCPKANPIECAELLKQKVLGYWAIKHIKSNFNTVPNYDAYVELMLALENQELNFNKAFEHINNAIAADPNFIEPYFYKVSYLISTNKFDEAYEVVNYLEDRRSEFSLYEKNFFLYLQALVKGDPKTAFKYFSFIYNLDKQDIQNNMNAAFLALNYLNNPSNALEILSNIEEDTIDYFKNNYSSIHRKILLARAYSEKAEYEKAIQELDNIQIFEKERIIREIKLRCYTRLGDYSKIDQILLKSSTEDLDKDYRYLYYAAAREFDLISDKENRDKYARKALALYKGSLPNKLKMIGRCMYMLEEWDNTQSHLKDYLQNKPNDLFSVAQMAAVLAHSGKESEAKEWIGKLEALSKPTNKKDIFYDKARILAILGDVESASMNLKLALTSGQTFSFFDFHNDPDIKKNIPQKELSQVLNHFR